jgi:hypothetical protein
MFGKWETEYNHKEKTVKIVHNGKTLLEWNDVQEDDWNTIHCNGMELDVHFYFEDGVWFLTLYPLKWINNSWQTNCDIFLQIGRGKVKVTQ